MAPRLEAGRLVHVGTVDAPVTVGDVKQIAVEFRKAVGKASIHRRLGASTCSAGTCLRGQRGRPTGCRQGRDRYAFRPHPQGGARQAGGRSGTSTFRAGRPCRGHTTDQAPGHVTLTNSSSLSMNVPEDVQRAVNKWPQWIDYWAVDWTTTATPSITNGRLIALAGIPFGVVDVA